MTTTLYECNALTGGGSNAVDAIAYSGLVNDDLVITTDSGHPYFHRWVATSTATPSSPGVIQPVDGGTNPGRWIQQETDFSTVDHNALVNYDPLKHKTSETIRGETGTALYLETRTSDPASPSDGRIWLRTDL